MKRLFALAILSVLCACLWGDEIFTYRMQKENEVDTFTMTVTDTGDGYIVRESQNQEKEERIVTANPSYSTQTFRFRNASTCTDYIAERTGNKISVTGMLNNRTLKREFSINENPWYQSMEQALGYFSGLARDNVKFWLINADECEIHEMEAAKIGAENISIMGASVQAQKIRVTLTGFASLFWSAAYWFGSVDCVYLRYETTEGPGGPKLVIELLKIGGKT